MTRTIAFALGLSLLPLSAQAQYAPPSVYGGSSSPSSPVYNPPSAYGGGTSWINPGGGVTQGWTTPYSIPPSSFRSGTCVPGAGDRC